MKGFRKISLVRLPKKFSKSQVPGTEMKFIAVEKQVSIVFRHVIFCVAQTVSSLKIGKKIYDFNVASYWKQETFYKTMPTPLAQPKYFEHKCIFVNGISYQNAMFGHSGGLPKSPKTAKLSQLHYL